MIRLKIFILPSALIGAFAIFTIYLWPEYVALQENQVILSEQREKRDNVQLKLDHIKSLTRELESDQKSTRFMEQYYPYVEDMEEVFNAFEQIRVVNNIELLDIEVSSEKLRGSGKITVNDRGEVLQPNELKVSVTSLEMSLTGDYENLLAFVRQADNMRHKITMSSYAFRNEAVDGGDFIVLDVVLSRPYAPMSHLLAGTEAEVFKKSSFDMDVIDMYKNQIQYSVIDLDQGTPDGRENPFVLGN